ncbi:hypothetical protein DICPUDRAFT_84221 [Dictyostelium purpureum]|uniref:Uncharacterized protein n=1 Tax=Dictyostelium purpureum TaxID=5786 RepID=F1A1Y7_DICPU|nr:uncharacterized protein DICPUDRAFT_84221 [Dictyostelium purpureum]EGC29791.1 hypothetical protein DICPUDRAFT_84221 [Dictyostelium purpureum]|eukprot:XP_003293677.1 hypothetical protein DICPUDRAFT_84221 [Dictyostelium purpureum]
MAIKNDRGINTESTPIKNELVSISLYSLKSICWCFYYKECNNQNQNNNNNNNNNNYNINNNKSFKIKIMFYSLTRTYLSSFLYFFYNRNIEKYLIWKLLISFILSSISIFSNKLDKINTKLNIFTRIYYTLYTQNLFYQKISYFKMVSSIINTFTEFKFEKDYLLDRTGVLLFNFGLSFILYEINLFFGLSMSIFLIYYKCKSSIHDLEFKNKK